MPVKKNSLNFKVSAGIKDIVGRDLITDDNIAVFELVKNSYDAHATFVQIDFLNIRTQSAKIVIWDNGKGMNSADLEKKWLFLGYSAKRDGTEDSDYRSKINQDKSFAGSKGIGRFSADRLGRKLRLETIKDISETKKEILEIDWLKFENDLTDEFIKIPVKKFPSQIVESKDHGTRLIITDLRSSWNRKKLIGLRKSLSKLINPDSGLNSKKFKININCPEELLEDENKRTKDFEKVNGEINNFIFEDLEIRTTKIEVKIERDFILTELKDGGTLIYWIKEKNPFKGILTSISFKVFYLNQSAKQIFKLRMGVATRDYGSIFVYKNNIRIFPYGEPNEDSFNLDKRKAQKPSLYLGNKDLIGRVEISGKNDSFKETSSRGNGFIKNDTYDTFLSFIIENLIKRLEKYVIDVQKWGDGIYVSIEDSNLDQKESILKDRITALISKISNSDDIVDIKYDNNILNILDEKQADSATSLVNNLFKIAKNSNNKKLLEVAEKTKERVEQLRMALIEAQKDSEEKTKELEEKLSENLFLKSIKSQDFDEIVSFVHHMGLSASVVDNYLTGIYKAIEAGKKIDSEYLKNLIRLSIFENKKILNISKFATKANFKLYTDVIELNLDEYIKEYLKNIVEASTKKQFEIVFENLNPHPLTFKFRPIELNILIDNLISNSKKAGATKFSITIKRNGQNRYQILFKDNGEGIEKRYLDKIFEFGYTTSIGGSGIGLYHIKEIVERLGGTLTVESKVKIGTTFTLILN